MKKIFILLSTSIFMTLAGYGQQRDTVKHKETAHQHMQKLIVKRLGVDSAKADQVNAVQERYKSGMAKVMSDKSLTDSQRRKAIDSLMRQKNGKLATMLTPEQQAKIIPSTERKEVKSVENKKQ